MKKDIQKTTILVESSDKMPDNLDLEGEEKGGGDIFPFFDRLVRLEDVDYLAPPMKALQRQVSYQ